MIDLIRDEDAKIVKPQEKPGSVGERLHNLEAALTNAIRFIEEMCGELDRINARLDKLEAAKPDFDTEGTA